MRPKSLSSSAGEPEAVAAKQEPRPGQVLSVRHPSLVMDTFSIFKHAKNAVYAAGQLPEKQAHERLGVGVESGTYPAHVCRLWEPS